MDLGRHTITTEAHLLISMVHHYRDMCPRRSHILAPLTEAASGPKGRKILWNDALGDYINILKRMIYAYNLLIYPYWTIPFMVKTNASNKQLGTGISQNNKPIEFF